MPEGPSRKLSEPVAQARQYSFEFDALIGWM